MQDVCVARINTVFYTTVTEVIQKFFNACVGIAWSGSACVRSLRA